MVLACLADNGHSDKPLETSYFCDNLSRKKKKTQTIISAKREVTWQLSTFDRHIKLQTGLKC